MMEESAKTLEEKMEVIKRFSQDALCALFDGKDPFTSGISLDEVYKRCMETLTVEALLSAD